MKAFDVTVAVVAGVAMFVAITLWVLFGIAGFRYYAASGTVVFEAAPVALFAIGMVAALVAGAYALSRRLGVPRGAWQVIGSLVVAALLVQVTLLLVSRGLDEDYRFHRHEIRRLVIAGAAVIMVAAVSLGLGYRWRGSRDAVVGVWLAGGSIAILIGFMLWTSWTRVAIQ